MEDLTIGQLAQQTGVSRKAIRLYEEKELILPSIKLAKVITAFITKSMCFVSMVLNNSDH